MIFRIIVDLAFPEQDAVDDIKDKVIDHLENAVIINEGQDNEERGFIQVEKCYHDEDPNRTCDLIGRWEVPRP